MYRTKFKLTRHTTCKSTIKKKHGSSLEIHVSFLTVLSRKFFLSSFSKSLEELRHKLKNFNKFLLEFDQFGFKDEPSDDEGNGCYLQKSNHNESQHNHPFKIWITLIIPHIEQKFKFCTIYGLTFNGFRNIL